MKKLLTVLLIGVLMSLSIACEKEEVIESPNEEILGIQQGETLEDTIIIGKKTDEEGRIVITINGRTFVQYEERIAEILVRALK